MRRSLFVVACMMAGCGTGTGSGNGTNNSGPLPEGTFIGTAQCDTFVEIGGLTMDDRTSNSVSLNVNEDGEIFFDGEPLRDGASFTGGTGSVVETYEITSADETSNGVSFEGNYYGFWNCGDSCTGYTHDGICDEVDFCALGTDCDDCGPLELFGQFSITFQRQGDAIRYTSLISSADPEDFVSQGAQCDGDLD